LELNINFKLKIESKMNNLNVILLVVVTFICSVNCMDVQGRADKSEKEMLQAAKNSFHLWKQTHGKRYNNETQENQKFKIWFSNKIKIDDHNTRFAQSLKTYTKELQKHHDKTMKEFLASSTGAKPQKNLNKRDTSIIPVSRQNLPTSVNHTNRLPPVKDQGQCG
jgi:hypothetical protein